MARLRSGGAGVVSRVSVVIPLFNKGPHISRALESVLAQSEQDFEIIVVNDASTDGGEEIVRRNADRRIRLVERDTPGPGGHAARNAGIKAAASPLIAFLDADDAWKPLFLETIMRMRAAFPQAGAYSTARCAINRGRVEFNDYRGLPEAPWEGIIPNYFASAIEVPVIGSSTVAIPRGVFASVGTFPEGEPAGGDLEMWFRIALKYPIAFSRYIGTTWYCDSINRIGVTVKMPEDPLILRSIRRAIAESSDRPALAESLRGYHDALIAMFAKRCLIEERPEAARRLLDSALTGRDAGLHLLTFFPGRALGVLIAARRRLLGLS